MSYPEDEPGCLEYNELQQCYHRANVDDLQVPGWQIVCIAHPTLIDKFRVTNINLRDTFLDVREHFVEFTGPFIRPDA